MATASSQPSGSSGGSGGEPRVRLSIGSPDGSREGTRGRTSSSNSHKSGADTTHDSDEIVSGLFAEASQALSEAGLLNPPHAAHSHSMDATASRGRSMDAVAMPHHHRHSTSSTGRPTAASLGGVSRGRGHSAARGLPPGLGLSPRAQGMSTAAGSSGAYVGPRGDSGRVAGTGSMLVPDRRGMSTADIAAAESRAVRTSGSFSPQGAVRSAVDGRYGAASTSGTTQRRSASKAYAVLGMQQPHASPHVAQPRRQSEAVLRAQLGLTHGGGGGGSRGVGVVSKGRNLKISVSAGNSPHHGPGVTHSATPSESARSISSDTASAQTWALHGTGDVPALLTPVGDDSPVVTRSVSGRVYVPPGAARQRAAAHNAAKLSVHGSASSSGGGRGHGDTRSASFGGSPSSHTSPAGHHHQHQHHHHHQHRSSDTSAMMAHRFASLSSVPETDGGRLLPADSSPAAPPPTGQQAQQWSRSRGSVSSAIDVADRTARLPGGRGSRTGAEMEAAGWVVPASEVGSGGGSRNGATTAGPVGVLAQRAGHDASEFVDEQGQVWRAVGGSPADAGYMTGRSASAAPVMGVARAGETLPRWSLSEASAGNGAADPSTLSRGSGYGAGAQLRISGTGSMGHGGNTADMTEQAFVTAADAAVSRQLAQDAATGNLGPFGYYVSPVSARPVTGLPSLPEPLPLSEPIQVSIVDVGWKGSSSIAAGGHVVFLLQVSTGVRIWHVQRRFSEFAALHQCLEAALNADAALSELFELPRFPSRQVLRTVMRGSAALGQERRALLQAYIASVVRRPELWAACDELVFFLDDRRRTLSLQVALRRLLRSITAVTEIHEEGIAAKERMAAAEAAGRAKLDSHDREALDQRVAASAKERLRLLVRIKAVTEALAAQAAVTAGDPMGAATRRAARASSKQTPEKEALSTKASPDGSKAGSESAEGEAASGAAKATLTTTGSKARRTATAAALEMRGADGSGGGGGGGSGGGGGGGGGASLANATAALRRAVLTVELMRARSRAERLSGGEPIPDDQTFIPQLPTLEHLKDPDTSARLLIRVARYLALQCAMDLQTVRDVSAATGETGSATAATTTTEAAAAAAAVSATVVEGAGEGAGSRQRGKKLTDRASGVVTHQPAGVPRPVSSAATAAATTALTEKTMAERRRDASLLATLLRMNASSDALARTSPLRQLMWAVDAATDALVPSAASRVRRGELLLLARRLVRDAIGCEAAATAASASLSFTPTGSVEVTVIVPSTSATSSSWFTSLTEHVARVAATHQRISRAFAKEERRAARRQAQLASNERCAIASPVQEELSEGETDHGEDDDEDDDEDGDDRIAGPSRGGESGRLGATGTRHKHRNRSTTRKSDAAADAIASAATDEPVNTATTTTGTTMPAGATTATGSPTSGVVPRDSMRQAMSLNNMKPAAIAVGGVSGFLLGPDDPALLSPKLRSGVRSRIGGAVEAGMTTKPQSALDAVLFRSASDPPSKAADVSTSSRSASPGASGLVVGSPGTVTLASSTAPPEGMTSPRSDSPGSEHAKARRRLHTAPDAAHSDAPESASVRGQRLQQISTLRLQGATSRKRETAAGLISRAPTSQVEGGEDTSGDGGSGGDRREEGSEEAVGFEAARSRDALARGINSAGADTGSRGESSVAPARETAVSSPSDHHSSRFADRLTASARSGSHRGGSAGSGLGLMEVGARLGARSLDGDGMFGFGLGLDGASSTATSGADDGALGELQALPYWMYSTSNRIMLVRNAGFVPPLCLRPLNAPAGSDDAEDDVAGDDGSRAGDAADLRYSSTASHSSDGLSTPVAGDPHRRRSRTARLDVVAASSDSVLVALTGPVVRWRVDNTLVEVRVNDWHGLAMARWIEQADRELDTAVRTLWEAKAADARLSATITQRRLAAEARSAARKAGTDPDAAAAAVAKQLPDLDDFLPGLPPAPRPHLLKRCLVLLRAWLEAEAATLQTEAETADAAAEAAKAAAAAGTETPITLPVFRRRRGPLVGVQPPCVSPDVLAVLVCAVISEAITAARKDEEAKAERKLSRSRASSVADRAAAAKAEAAAAISSGSGLGLLTTPLQVLATVCTRFGRGLFGSLARGAAVTTVDGTVDLATYRSWVGGSHGSVAAPAVDAWTEQLREFSAGCDLAERRALQAEAAGDGSVSGRSVLPTGVGVPAAAQPSDGLVPEELTAAAMKAFSRPIPQPLATPLDASGTAVGQSPPNSTDTVGTLLVASPVAPWRNLAASCSPGNAKSLLLCLRGAASRVMSALEKADTLLQGSTSSAVSGSDPPREARSSSTTSSERSAASALSLSGVSRPVQRLMETMLGSEVMATVPFDESTRSDLRTHPLQRHGNTDFDLFEPSTQPAADLPEAAAVLPSARGKPGEASAAASNGSASDPDRGLPVLTVNGVDDGGNSLHPLTHIPEFPADHPFQSYRNSALKAREAEAMLERRRANGETITDESSIVTTVFDGDVAAAMDLIRQTKHRLRRMAPTPNPLSLLDPDARSPLHCDSPDFASVTAAQAVAATMIKGPTLAMTHPLFGPGLKDSAEAALKPEAFEPGAGISKGRQARNRRNKLAKGRRTVLNPEADWWRTHDAAAGVGIRLFLLSHAAALDAIAKGSALGFPANRHIEDSPSSSSSSSVAASSASDADAVTTPPPTGSATRLDALRASDSLMDSDIDLLWTVMTGRLTVGGIISILYRELRWTGHLSIAQLGKALKTASGWAHLPEKVKDRLGGLKRFISRFPSVFHLGSNHLFNPQVCLRDSVGVFLWISMHPDEALVIGLDGTSSKKKNRGKGKKKSKPDSGATAHPAPATAMGEASFMRPVPAAQAYTSPAGATGLPVAVPARMPSSQAQTHPPHHRAPQQYQPVGAAPAQQPPGYGYAYSGVRAGFQPQPGAPAPYHASQAQPTYYVQEAQPPPRQYAPPHTQQQQYATPTGAHHHMPQQHHHHVVHHPAAAMGATVTAGIPVAAQAPHQHQSYVDPHASYTHGHTAHHGHTGGHVPMPGYGAAISVYGGPAGTAPPASSGDVIVARPHLVTPPRSSTYAGAASPMASPLGAPLQQPQMAVPFSPPTPLPPTPRLPDSGSASPRFALPQSAMDAAAHVPASPPPAGAVMAPAPVPAMEPSAPAPAPATAITLPSGLPPPPPGTMYLFTNTGVPVLVSTAGGPVAMSSGTIPGLSSQPPST